MTGLGAVEASYTVNIRPQVDGRLETVMFVEGQVVKKGDILALVDRRPCNAALEGAIAQKALDQANLICAEKDLGRARALAIRSYETQQKDVSASRVPEMTSYCFSWSGYLGIAAGVLP